MQIDARNRTELKAFFVKNAIPTEGNFGDLIDAMLSQSDDGIAKPAGNPLCIEATGDQKKTINFYDSFSDPNPTWTVSQNPRVRPNDASSARPGFSIGEGTGASRLFIENATGRLGIGTIETTGAITLKGDGATHPVGLTQGHRGGSSSLELTTTDTAGNQASRIVLRGASDAADVEILRGARGAEQPSVAVKGDTGNVGIGIQNPDNLLDVRLGGRTGTHPTGRALYVSSPARDGWSTQDGIEFRHSNGTQGIGFGFNTIYATGTNADQPLRLKPRGKSVVEIGGGAWVRGNLPEHVDADGVLYRFGGQVYLTVDDHFYIRDSGGEIQFHFQTNTGVIVQENWHDVDPPGTTIIGGPIAMPAPGPGGRVVVGGGGRVGVGGAPVRVQKVHGVFQNGWLNYRDSGWNPAAYFKDSMGVVHLRGLIKHGSGTIFTLPEGYRPPRRELFVAATAGTGTGRVDVEPNGKVTMVRGSVAGNGWISLDGMTFRAK